MVTYIIYLFKSVLKATLYAKSKSYTFYPFVSKYMLFLGGTFTTDNVIKIPEMNYQGTVCLLDNIKI